MIKHIYVKVYIKQLTQQQVEDLELPIGRWTEDYKEILNKMVIERGSKADNGGHYRL